MVVVCKYRNRVLEIENRTEPNLKNQTDPALEPCIMITELFN